MAHILFTIPANRSELLSELSTNYTVRNVTIPAEIVQKLQEARSCLRDEGVTFILDHFDTYYSVLHHGDKLPNDVTYKAYDDLSKATTELHKSIDFILEDKDSLNQELQAKTLNVLKMLLYIYTQFVIYLEQKRAKQDEMTNTKTTKQKTKVPDTFKVNKAKVLEAINNVIQTEINLFWDPPVVEHDFVQMLAEVGYSFLQAVSIKNQREVISLIFGVFGNLIKSYDYGKTFVARIVQTIRMYEHVVQFVPEGVQLLVEQFSCTQYVHHLVKEATEWQVDQTYQDVQGARCCSIFLVELSVLMPELMIPEVVHLGQYLSFDSVPLRTSILTVVAEVIIRALTQHDLDDAKREFRDEFLAILLAHLYDVAALVRAKALQCLARLQKECSIPMQIQHEVLGLVIDRLDDKGTNVRKAAVNCVTAFLEHNPFGANLQLSQIEDDLQNKRELLTRLEDTYGETRTQKLAEMQVEWNTMQEEMKAAIEQYIENESDDEDELNEEFDENNPHLNKDRLVKIIRTHIRERKYVDAFKLCRQLKNSMPEWKEMEKLITNTNELDLYLMILRMLYMDAERINEELRTAAGMTEEDIQKLQALEKIIQYLDKTAVFLRVLNSAIKPIKQMLFTTTISDMHEAINFFVNAYQFQLDNASDGVTEMLKLMQYNDPERKEAVIDAFKTIYLTTESTNMAEHTTTILDRLISLIKTINHENFTDFENIVSEWTSKGILDNSVIDMCWQYYTGRVQSPIEDARAAAELLRMASLGRNSLIMKNIKVVTTIALSDPFKDDMLFLSSSLSLLAVAGKDKIDIKSEESPFKVKSQEKFVVDLTAVLTEKFFEPVPFYSEMLRAALDFVFRMCSKPMAVGEAVLNGIVGRLGETMPLFVTVRLCELLGLLALNTLECLDNTVYRELKRRNFVREERKEGKKAEKKAEKKDIKSKKKAKAAERMSVSATTTINDSTMNETVLEGAEAEDTDAEFILNVLENDIVCGSATLGQFVPFLKNICEKPASYPNVLLQKAAVTALMRFMLISSKFCRENIQFLFTIFEKTTFPKVKCQILIHCSDLLIRFPNVVEPWSPRIYENLKDPLVQVRKTAFFALSSLILKDMIRAHSHISEMAACLIDDNPEVVHMCQNFFIRLSQKENNLSNVVPDIFSNLVKIEAISEENLRGIMKYIFDLIDKSKRMENIVDRFCYKYTVAEDWRLNRNITYCLSLINYSDRALRKLQEKFPHYKHHLHDAEIYSLFKQILAEASKPKIGKTDLKPIATDIENAISSVFEVDENNENPKRPPVILKTAKKTRKPSTRKKVARKQLSGESDGDDDVEESTKKAKRNNRKKTVIASSSDSDE